MAPTMLTSKPDAACKLPLKAAVKSATSHSVDQLLQQTSAPLKQLNLADTKLYMQGSAERPIIAHQ